MSGEQGGDAPRWYVIRTKPKQEDRADHNLRVLRVETFAPKLRESRCKQGTGEQAYVIKPLFPRYIFARFDIHLALRKICFARGIHSVVSFGDGPTPVDENIIALLQSRTLKDGFVRIGEKLDYGDQIIVKYGALRGVVGIFEHETKDVDRVMILLTAVSYQPRIIIERKLIEKHESDKTKRRQGPHSYSHPPRLIC
jgi:transcriptional antiterminator RfaH